MFQSVGVFFVLFSFPTVFLFSCFHLQDGIRGSMFASCKEKQETSITMMSASLSRNGNRKMSKIEKEIEILRERNECLSLKCRRLEAQNIISAAQELNLLARFLGVSISATLYYLYLQGIWYSLSFEHWSSALVRLMASFLPYIHHRLKYGLYHRRIDVYVVAFIMILRIKLVRWRINTFIKTGGTNSEDKNSRPFGESLTENDIWEASKYFTVRK